MIHLVLSFIATPFLQLLILVSIILLLFAILFLIYYQAKNYLQLQKTLSLPYQQSPYQNYLDLKSIRNQLKSNYQTFHIYYSIYKQFLYLSSATYHGTSLTSIFAIHKQNSSQIPQSKPQKTFQSQSLTKFHQIIIKNTSILILNLQQILSKLQKSNLLLKNTIKTIKISDLLKYHLQTKTSFNSLKEKVSNLNQDISILKNHQNHQFSLESIQKSMSLLSQIQTFLTQIIKNLSQNSEVDQKNIFFDSQSIKKEIQTILSQFCDNVFQNDSQVHEKQQNNNNFEVKTKILKSIDEFMQRQIQISEGKEGQIDFLTREIERLNKLEDSVKISKNMIQSLKIQHNNQSSQIKIYAAGSHSTVPQNALQKHKSTHFQVEQSQTAFSIANKLGFIKQLDRLMIRNKIRRQMDEMEQKIKLQQHLDSLKNQQTQSNVILQKI